MLLYGTRNSGRFAPFFLPPAVQAADQDGRFDTLISSLGQLVVELLSVVPAFVMKSEVTSGRTNELTD